MKLASILCLMPTSLLAVACGGVDATDDKDMIDPGDVEAPVVVSTTPTASQSGVGAQTKIHITFSEAMDPGTVEAAYSSAQLPLDQISMQWNEAHTVLTISPDQPLAYGEGIGNDPAAAERLNYSISIGAGAADLAGNPIAAPLDLTFSTKVRMYSTAALAPTLSRTTLGGSTLGEQINIIAGDSTLNNIIYRGYVSFDLAALPPSAVVEQASFSARQLSMDGTPYAVLGALKAYHLTFATMTGVGSVLPLSSPGAFSQDGTAESKSIDVSPQVADDVAHRQERGNLTQYRLQFDTETDGDAEYDRATFARDTFEMSLVYVAD